MRDPPFVNLLPLAEAMTSGLAAAGTSMVGARATASVAAAPVHELAASQACVVMAAMPEH